MHIMRAWYTDMGIHSAKPQSLFAKTASKSVNAATAKGQDMFADIPRTEQKEGEGAAL
jgi:hypothetical protein